MCFNQECSGKQFLAGSAKLVNLKTSLAEQHPTRRVCNAGPRKRTTRFSRLSNFEDNKSGLRSQKAFTSVPATRRKEMPGSSSLRNFALLSILLFSNLIKNTFLDRVFPRPFFAGWHGQALLAKPGAATKQCT
jgi:hypothetical protein